ncbi:MAG: hypothetical protein KC416_00725 [Myxococcales bacterium]|nr:hypothetical protein [Myxococcales bacterium]
MLIVATAGLVGLSAMGTALETSLVTGSRGPAGHEASGISTRGEAVPASGPSLTGQAGLASGATRAARLSDDAVREIRRVAATIPEGQTRVFRSGGQPLTLHRILSREQLFDFARSRLALSSNPAEALAQTENWADLVDRAFDESLARGKIPGTGGSITRKGLEGLFDFLAADGPPGAFVYNAHGNRTGMSVAHTLVLEGKDGAQTARMKPGSRPLSVEAIAADLRRRGHHGEPLLLDSCSTGQRACLPDNIARRLANHLDVPVVAPTKPIWVTRPTPERPFRARLAGDVLDAAGYPIAAGDWVLVLPDAWSTQVIRGMHTLE